MKFSLKQLVAVAFVAGMSSVAFAAPTPNITPTATPTNNDNGSLILAAWDPTTGRSIVKHLGLSISDIGIPAMTEAGTVIDFGSIDLSLLNGTVASTPGVVQFAVFAADADRNGSSGAQNRNLNLYTTGTGLDQVTRGQLFNAATAVGTYFGNAFNNADQCAGANPCVTGQDNDTKYFGNEGAYGSQLSALDPNTTSISGLLNTALNFFRVSTPNSGTNSSGTQLEQYTAGGIYGQWLLDTTGRLTYSFVGDTAPVPLPAAAWLLVSGLMGVGVIGRRRRNAVAA